jgi:hypothetical protein
LPPETKRIVEVLDGASGTGTVASLVWWLACYCTRYPSQSGASFLFPSDLSQFGLA